MRRSPMPAIGSVFTVEFGANLEEAFKTNPSIHDVAIVFVRDSLADEYRLTAWSMRIFSKAAPNNAEPNLGSAHNSALALSESPNIDLCCVVSRDCLVLYEGGVSYSIWSR
jgi:hypothetical protein